MVKVPIEYKLSLRIKLAVIGFDILLLFKIKHSFNKFYIFLVNGQYAGTCNKSKKSKQHFAIQTNAKLTIIRNETHTRNHREHHSNQSSTLLLPVVLLIIV